ncbi:MAG: PilZ domain-containing protein [Elusimicrobiota bacterium]
MFNDKRRAFRRPVEWNVKIELNGKSFETSCINISEGGIRIEGTKDDLHLTNLIIEHLADDKKTQPEIEIKVPTTFQELQLKGKIKWFHTDNVLKQHHIGIAFENQPDIQIFHDSMRGKSGITLFPK